LSTARDLNEAKVAHAYNPSYSGSRDQEHHGQRQIVLQTLSQKYPTQKKELAE
jgi:hypothetical protein